jgi:glycosyltransferase involved in cell wall biosynthesis
VKIVHVAKMTSVAGMEKHLLTLLPGLQARGLDVSLIVLVEPGKPMDDYVAHMQQSGVQTETMVIRRDLDPLLIGRLARKFREGRYDAVHTHLIHADLHGVIAAKRAGVRRIFLTGHNDDQFRRRWPIRFLQRWLWRQVTAGIAISEALRQFIITVESAPPERVHTVHYGLDPAAVPIDLSARQKLCEELGIHPNAPIAGSICRLTGQKGLSTAIRAFWQIAEQAQGAQYVIVGDGPLRQSLQREAEGFGLGQRIHFLGWRDDAGSLVGAFDVLLMPSLWEGFGLVALEAMAASRPVIASRVSALPEIVENGVTGYLADPADPSALAECLLDILQNPALAREMGENGRRRLEAEFSVDRMIDGTLRVYQFDSTVSTHRA